MGNRVGSQSHTADAQLSMPQCLEILAKSQSTMEARHQAFERARMELAPGIAGTQAYAAELRRVFGLRFEPWAAAGCRYIPNDATKLNEHALADRIRGLVFGAALGDAVGLSTEFMSRAEVAKNYPESHVFRPSAATYPDTHRMMFPQADWTDDTDQLLLILQTLLEHGGNYNDSFCSKLLAWKEHGFAELGDQGGAGLGQNTKAVLQQPDFVTNAAAAAERVWKKKGCKVASNGAVMRTAITGVPEFWSMEKVRSNTVAFCCSTHADPRCIASCIVITECVRMLLMGEDNGSNGSDSAAIVAGVIDRAVDQADTYLNDCSAAQNMCDNEPVVSEVDMDKWRAELRRFSNAESIHTLELDDPHTIGYTFKCMGCAVWALRSSGTDAQTFVNAIEQIARAGGDSDTNGAVAGALIGARIGFSCLPQDWVSELTYGVWLEAWVQKILWMMQLPVVAAQR